MPEDMSWGGQGGWDGKKKPRVRSGPIGLPSKGSLSISDSGLGPGPAKRSLKSR